MQALTAGHMARLPIMVHGSAHPPVVAHLRAATGGRPYTAGWINLMWTDLGLQGGPKVKVFEPQGFGDQTLFQGALNGALDILPHSP